jgi:hypothetical protein
MRFESPAIDNVEMIGPANNASIDQAVVLSAHAH